MTSKTTARWRATMKGACVAGGMGVALSAAPLREAHAQDVQVAAALGTVVITAAGIEQDVSDTLPHTTVITEAEIRASGKLDLPSLLRGAAGVDITQSGGVGTISAAFIRGSSSQQVLVLVDGMRIGSATSGAAALENILLDEVDHVEIVRGNVSALYGSGAVGGVIQIFTRRGDGTPRGSANVEVGSHATRRVGAGYAGRIGETRFSVHLSHFETTGISAMDPAVNPSANPDEDGYRNTSLSLGLVQSIGSQHRLSVDLYHSQGKADYDNPLFPPFDNRTADGSEYNDAATTLLSGAWRADWSALWRSTLRLSYTEDKADSVSDSIVVGDASNPAPHPLHTVDKFRTKSSQLDWKNDLRFAPDQVLSLGATALEQKVDSSVSYDRDRRRTNSVYASYNGQFAAVHQLQLGLRHDSISDIGGATTGLAGYAYHLTPAWRLSASTSTAFNAPTFNDLFYPGFSNPALKPEKARSVEAALQYAEGPHLVRLTWFDTRYRDLIEYDFVANQSTNVGRARSRGVELSGSTKFDDWTLQAAATAQNPRNEDTGELLNRRARRFGSIGVARDVGAWRVGAQVEAYGKRLDFGTPLDRYTLVHLNGAWHFLPGWSLEGRISNLTDRDYRTVAGYNTPGREVFVGVAWRP